MVDHDVGDAAAGQGVVAGPRLGVDEGDEIAVRGVWRREATPTTVALGGYRVAAFLPTISAAVAYQP